jgi:hypothetical protein
MPILQDPPAVSRTWDNNTRKRYIEAAQLAKNNIGQWVKLDGDVSSGFYQQVNGSPKTEPHTAFRGVSWEVKTSRIPESAPKRFEAWIKCLGQA